MKRLVPAPYELVADAETTYGFALYRRRDEGDIMASISALRRAVAMYDELYAKRCPGSPSRALCVHHLGNSLFDADRYAEAQVVYERLLEIDRRQYPGEEYPAGHYNIALALAHVARARGVWVALRPPARSMKKRWQ